MTFCDSIEVFSFAMSDGSIQNFKLDIDTQGSSKNDDSDDSDDEYGEEKS
jgi:hypothetical protein